MPKLLCDNPAFGRPGLPPSWAAGNKDAVGTAYSAASQVWFTIWRGILTEAYFPTVDQPQIRDCQFLITDEESFFHEEKRHLESSIERLSFCPGYRITNRDPEGRYTIIKEIITDPHLPCILQNTKLIAEPQWYSRLKLYLLCAPHIHVGGSNNNAQVAEIAGKKILTAWKDQVWLAIAGTMDFSKTSCGFVAHSDGWTDLNQNRLMDWQFDSAFDGNVAVMGEIKLPDTSNNIGDFTVGLSFGYGAHSAIATLLQALDIPFAEQTVRYQEQWRRSEKSRLALEKVSADEGKLYWSSVQILLSHEDKMNPGALIASLSIPWGEAKGDEDLGGYHLVWPRDMVNSATGLLAAGNTSTPRRALIFLAASQRPDGSFPQNFWINGEPYWQGLQLDEVAFPILLAWRLKCENALKNFDPYAMVINAAIFLVFNGPITQQERWEENAGYSPSTIAANIAALICAACFAKERGNSDLASFFEDYADYLKCHIEEWTVTNSGTIHPDIKEHFIRVNPIVSPDLPADIDHLYLHLANRYPGEKSEYLAKDIVDAGFLELVRYGIFSPKDKLIRDSLVVIDAVLKVETPFGPCWRRYNHDGYGQGKHGEAYTGYGIGRPWPLLTGERGHYELAAGNDPSPYIEAMENFASAAGCLPEQIWDGPIYTTNI